MWTRTRYTDILTSEGGLALVPGAALADARPLLHQGRAVLAAVDRRPLDGPRARHATRAALHVALRPRAPRRHPAVHHCNTNTNTQSHKLQLTDKTQHRTRKTTLEKKHKNTQGKH